MIFLRCLLAIFTAILIRLLAWLHDPPPNYGTVIVLFDCIMFLPFSLSCHLKAFRLDFMYFDLHQELLLLALKILHPMAFQKYIFCKTDKFPGHTYFLLYDFDITLFAFTATKTYFLLPVLIFTYLHDIMCQYTVPDHQRQLIAIYN